MRNFSRRIGRRAVGFAVLGILGLCNGGRAAETPNGKWVDLFNGKSLAGWLQQGGKANYRVENGEIVGTTVPNTANSFLCTTNYHGDFILELEFKVQDGLNSGVQIRSHCNDVNQELTVNDKVLKIPAGRVHGYQVEIDTEPRAWTGGIYDESRRGWLNNLEQNEPARKAFKHNEWNKFRIEAKGDSIKTWLNGVPAADLTDSMTPTGFIALQVHGVKDKVEPMEVRWRNIRIQDLPGSKDPVSAPKAFLDGTGPGWKTLGEADFAHVNGDPDTWTWKDGGVFCTGLPVGVTRSAKTYENFELVARWKHHRSGGNSGIFVWAPEAALEGIKPGMLPRGGIEVQMLDHGYFDLYKKQTGKDGTFFSTNGDIFPVGTSKLTPFPPLSPDGSRSFPRKKLSKGVGEWNHYYVRAVNGEVRLWVNGEEVSGGTGAVPAKGYLCLEAEGSPVEFKDIKIRELP
ncbi:3-keto-disaccharide hydrolase [Singulisphaera acidiphila]|uniref:3-keto-alpha-glucoside-1,2-lyase/3-keto-2-hydroxy-glucal hydratase domain-containing protein n=1 Tax=Singulisphaera acidiphila (strain ATCC BAA-1392 / DSM 18658 / VKM B-2454 / MOB10) TaxID=886293 RepID=L0DKD6_SINAD|nr:DUF1080 domain-containing protein [Singulisphaera acidiphila]AGA29844.1 protein of unknown function (DUF1080) [Singulisphaera acidiphila DSM 18658]